jgi:glycosyltransferase involved in cell wall biosynthesis
VRVLIFHGYLLSGTGSNVYNALLAQELVRQGHDVHLFCQDRRADKLPFVDVVADWDEGSLRVRGRRAASGVTAYRPDIGGLLPVYVADRYPGIEARPFLECSDAEVDRYVQANVAAVAEVAERVAPEAALANHLVMGPLILARALGGSTPYAVKIHGSALEYVVRRDPQRFLPAAREGLAAARGVLVGSRYIASSLWQTIDDPALAARTRLGPPGVDTRRFRPLSPSAATDALRGLAQRLRQGEQQDRAGRGDELGDAFARDAGEAAHALAGLHPAREPLVAFVGKLIVSKGADLAVAAWPLVLARHPDARLVIVGFGAYRAALEQLIDALAGGDLAAAIALARRGRAAEGGKQAPLRLLLAFLERLGEERREPYLRAARALPERVTLTGRLEHDELADLLPACQALVVPSTFPEAFGMVAVEAAACGALPISAAHSGLAEVSAALAEHVSPQAAPWLAFPLDEQVVEAIAERLVAWLGAEPELRLQTRTAIVGAVGERWSWTRVANGVLAAAQGHLDGLPVASEAAPSRASHGRAVG